MKTLQKDLTTPEQSKRLLELGVPKVTANYYYDSRDFKPQAHEVRGHWNEEEDYAARRGYKITPLWSTGRLMEIFDMCCINKQSSNVGWCSYRKLYKNQTYIDYILYVFTINKMQDFMDFSKLEE